MEPSDYDDQVRALPEPATSAIQLAMIFHALGDPLRLELVRRLYEQTELNCSADGLAAPKSTLSNHWRILREAGLTTTVIEGREHRMRLRQADLDTRFPGLLQTALQAISAN
jgi:DNA-binding transcriptional ArsR family regulator